MAIAFTPGRLALGSVFAAVGVYSAMTYRRLSQTQGMTIIKDDYASPSSFRKSPTMVNIVNPRQHPEMAMDTRWTKLRIDRQHSDEEILAHFVRGFFGGLVFAPEAFFANYVIPSPTRLTALKDAPVPLTPSKKADLPTDKMLPLYSRVVDLFQVTDSNIVHSQIDRTSESESFIDFAFGSDESRFAGAKRFSLSRSAEDPEVVTVGYTCIVLNPLTGKNIMPPGGVWFHRLYAMLLFRDAVSDLQRTLKTQKC